MASSISERAPRRSIIACALAAVAAAVTLADAGTALAAPAGSRDAVRDAARAKLVEGVDALKRGEHQLALDRFEAAYALVPSPKIHYDFGLAYVGLGRHADALAAFERFLAEAHDAPADKRDKAARQTAALRPQVGAVAIAVAGAPDGTAITVDGREVGRAPLARPVYLDPGPHEVSARPSGGVAASVQRIDVRAGGRVEVVLRVDDAGATTTATGAATTATGAATTGATVAPPPPAPSPPATGLSLEAAPPAERDMGTRRIAALSLGAAGIVLIGAGVTFGVLAKRESDSVSSDAASLVNTGMRATFDPDKEARGTRYETLQVIGLVAGALGLSAGIVLHATTRGRVTVEPAVARSIAGANLQVAF